jgi:hypothetical protein
MPKRPVNNDFKMKSVNARKRILEGSTISGLLRGKTKTGKSQFALSLHKMNVEDAYEKLYGEKIHPGEWVEYEDGVKIWVVDWENVEANEKIANASAHCLTCTIDMDIEGQEQLLERPDVFPIQISDSWEKWPVTGSPMNTPNEDYEHRFDEAVRARDYYLDLLKKHKQKYPEFNKQRTLILEDCGELWEAVDDHFFYKTTKGRLRTFAEHYDEITAEKVFRGKPKKGEPGVAMFPLGQMHTFGPINKNFQAYFRDCMIFKRTYGYNFYATARQALMKERDDKGKETGKMITFTTGKTYMLDAFLDLVITFVKIKKPKSDEIIHGLNTIDENPMNRLGPDFRAINHGARHFFERLKLEKMKSKVEKEESDES